MDRKRKCFICSVTKEQARDVVDVIEKQSFEVVYEEDGEDVLIYVIPDGQSTNIDVFHSVIDAMVIKITE